MRAGFDNAGLVHDADEVGTADCGETVGDYKSGAAVHEAVEGFLNEGFTLAVEGGSCFVENENRGVFENGACDRYALALTA